MVNRLVAGPNVYICNECIALCNEILNDEEFLNGEEAHEQIGPVKLPSPAEMKKTLDLISYKIMEKTFPLQTD